MAGLGSSKFRGKSGKIYHFDTCDYNSSWSSVACVYVVVRRIKDMDGNIDTAIYVGQTYDLKKRLYNHDKKSCFTRNDANCLCILLEKDEKKRKEIVSDLLAAFSTPCNSLWS